MALTELYEIGKRSRNPLKGVSKESQRGKRLVVEVENGEDGGSAISSGQEERSNHSLYKSVAAAPAPSTSLPTSSRPQCIICRLEVSKYNCPSCNIPYCSLTCYRSKQHSNCSQPFLEKSLRSEMGQDEKKGMVNEEERIAMMDVLRRMKTLGQEEALGKEEEGEDEEVGEDGSENGEVRDIDLDGASIEELLSMLSPEERARFEAAVQDDDPNQVRAQALFEKLFKEQQGTSLTSPWWKEYNDRDNDLCSSGRKFIDEATRLASQSPKATTAKIEYNIIAVLLAYALIVRNLDVQSLQKLLRTEKMQATDNKADDDMPPLEPIEGDPKDYIADEREELRDVAKRKLVQFAPFLDVSGEASRLVMDSVEQVTLYFAAAWVHHEATTASSEPAAKAISFLYKDVEALISQTRLVEVSSSVTSTSRAILALSDLEHFLSPPSKRKILFYGAYWLRLSDAERQALTEQLTSENARLTAELQRAEDEERFQAANDAIHQQIVY